MNNKDIFTIAQGFPVESDKFEKAGLSHELLASLNALTGVTPAQIIDLVLDSQTQTSNPNEILDLIQKSGLWPKQQMGFVFDGSERK